MNSVFTVRLLQNLRDKKADKGFTLIELLVVVIIIGVLAAVALPNLLAQVGKARESEGKTGVGTITRAQQTRHFETGLFEDEDDAGFSVLAGNSLSITVDSEYFVFAADAAGGTTSAATVGVTAVAPDGATLIADGFVTGTDTRTALDVAQANGTRAFGSRMDFAAGNYASVLCQTNTVIATAPGINAPVAAVVDATTGAITTPAQPARCAANNTEVR